MRKFGTEGRVEPAQHYFVPRTNEIVDFINRVRAGKYIVLFAPRQTGKTTFFRCLIDVLREGTGTESQAETASHQTIRQNADSSTSDAAYFSIRLDFQVCRNLSTPEFYTYLSKGIQSQNSVGIIGVKSINQLNYDRFVSPFNIQDEFRLPNFTREQVQELIEQYMDEVGQVFAPEVIESIHKQTAGQPVLVNRFAQILTEELDIAKNEMITMAHFTTAHTQLLRGRNTNIEHLTTNIRKDPRFEMVLFFIIYHSFRNFLDFRRESQGRIGIREPSTVVNQCLTNYFFLVM